ncbi:MAG: Crp/Fnr family transcriptional regulator [Clostridia bacterium]|nr:Crp/Fnr family transcriptional regulator [Clostridia bacterium]
MKKYLPVIKKCPLFDGVSNENLARMLGCLKAKVVDFDKKYTVFREGTVQKHVGILLSGSLHLVRMDYYGNRSILSGVEIGETFLEEFACSEAELPVSVIADEPSQVLILDLRHILHTCSNCCSFHQQIIFNLMKILATKNTAFYQKIDVTSKRSTREKLLTYLNYQAKKTNNNEFNIPFDRQELADYLEVERSGLSMEISKLKNEGIIDSYKNYFKLL